MKKIGTMNNMTSDHSNETEPTRRDFLILTAGAVGSVGALGALWPFINSMNPAADTLALSSIEIDLQPIQPGQSITAMWRGKPLFVRHRTPQEIQEARSVDIKILKDPEEDQKRVQKEQWLVLVGVCTHLGCVPGGQKNTDQKGEYNGWFCSCHGSQYDTSGRIRKGPAPKNLVIPPYTFLSDTRIKIG